MLHSCIWVSEKNRCERKAHGHIFYRTIEIYNFGQDYNYSNINLYNLYLYSVAHYTCWVKGKGGRYREKD